MPLGEEQKIGWTGQGTELWTSRRGLVKNATEFIQMASTRLAKATTKYQSQMNRIQSGIAEKYAESDTKFAEFEKQLRDIQAMREAGTLTERWEVEEIRIMKKLDQMLELGPNIKKETRKFEGMKQEAERIKLEVDELTKTIAEVQQLEMERLQMLAAHAEAQALKVKEAEAAQQAAQATADTALAAKAAENLAAAQAAANAAAAHVTQQASQLQNATQGYQNAVSQTQQTVQTATPVPTTAQVVEQKAVIAATEKAAEIIATAPPELQEQLAKEAAQEIATKAAQATGQPEPYFPPPEMAPAKAAIPSWMKYVGLIGGGLTLRKLF